MFHTKCSYFTIKVEKLKVIEFIIKVNEYVNMYVCIYKYINIYLYVYI